MRVIAGEYKGRRLSMPKGVAIRPTSDKVKEAMFQVLARYLPGTDVLELFAGSGALGIEALSRGAASVTFVEKEPRCVKTIEQNLSVIRGTREEGRGTIVQDDAFAAVKHFAREGRKFSIIIADPPYNRGYVKKLLNKLDEYDILKKPFFLMIERHIDEKPPEEFSALFLIRHYKHSDTILSIYKHRDKQG